MRKNPGHGITERSRTSRKISVALPNDHMDFVQETAARLGVSSAEVVRRAVEEWFEGRNTKGSTDERR